MRLNLVYWVILISIALITSHVKVLLEFLLNLLILGLPISLVLCLLIELLIVRLLHKLIVLIMMGISLRLRNQNIWWIRYLCILSVWIFLTVYADSIWLLIRIIIPNTLFSFYQVLHAVMSLHIVYPLILLVGNHLLVLLHSYLHFWILY